ncbi:hypothetical protein P691DRAFT_836518 [Macrolepiota fuliginosa MF-IS2]|uniref:G domain-containing protein n=1 Tax=Macrolepiota fuliginosa MF-IS2 TaxID=1400762 RepID=A0A9P6BYR1_9AGAR|nr:hypothetical protein P691DRAFT_836518 [Macrolepiota fuliginosa MF-IS2]
MPFNVILFGESGAGKSSLVNLMCGNNHAAISSAANGCTLDATPYDYYDSSGTSFRFWDTAGLNEGDGGRVPRVDAIVRLYSLIMRLHDGISLLVFVMRAPRIRDASVQNWVLFREIICRSQVPITIAVTGLEGEDNMDQWWYSNQYSFHQQGIYPNGHACVAGTRGKQNRDGTHKLDGEYHESREKMLEMVRHHYLRQPWRPHRVEWFREIVEVSYESRGRCRSPRERRDVRRVACQAIGQLTSQCKMTEQEAHGLAERLSTA